MKKNVIYFFILVLGASVSILFLIQELKKEKTEYLALAVIIASTIIGFCIGLFVRKYSFLDFLKILLPTSATLIAAIWLLSSGYLNITRENIIKEVFDLQESKVSLQKSISNFVVDSTVLSNSNFNLKKENDSINDVYSKSVGQLQIQFKEKTKELEKINVINEELEIQNKLYVSKTISIIKNFLHDRFVISNQSTKVKCIGLLESGGLLVSVFDENGKQLTDKKVEVHTSVSTGYPDHQPIFVHYDERTKKFKLQHTIRNNVGHFAPNSEEESIKNMVFVKFKKTGNAIEDAKFAHWPFEVPFNDAEYEVVIHRQ